MSIQPLIVWGMEGSDRSTGWLQATFFPDWYSGLKNRPRDSAWPQGFSMWDMTSTKPGTNVYDLNANDYADTVSARPPCLLTKRTQQELRGHRLVNFLWFLTDFKETIRRNKLFGGVNISKDNLVKRNSPTRFSTSRFIHHSNLPGPLSNGVKFFRFWLRFRWVIRSLVSKKLTPRSIILRGVKKYVYPILKKRKNVAFY